MRLILFASGFATGILISILTGYALHMHWKSPPIPLNTAIEPAYIPYPRIKYALADIIAHIKYYRRKYPECELFLDFYPYISCNNPPIPPIKSALNMHNMIDIVDNTATCIVELTPIEMEYIHITAIGHYIDDDVFFDSIE
jgi:hypothetical protein